MTVYWLGGSVCAGKSTVARMLARDRDAVIYAYDHAERDHLERAGRADRIIDRIEEPDARRLAHDERWLHRTPADMALRTTRAWSDRFPLVLEDLRDLSADRVVAEGAGLFPYLVAPMLRETRHGVWLIATDDFIRWARRRRGTSAPAMTSDPALAWENIIARDRLMARSVRAEAEGLGLTTITVDGSEPAEALAARIADLFGWAGGSEPGRGQPAAP